MRNNLNKTDMKTNYELIAETGNISVIKDQIRSLELQKIKGLFTEEDEANLIMLRNSLNWYRPIDYFGMMKVFEPNVKT